MSSNNFATEKKFSSDFFNTLESLNWANDLKLASSLQTSLAAGTLHSICITTNVSYYVV